MKINIVSKQMPVTDAIKGYAEKKVARIEKYFPGDEIEVTVTFYVQKNDQTAEVLVNNKGIYLKGLEKTGDIYASLDGAIDKIEKQVARYKDRLKERKHDDKAKGSFTMNVYSASSIETREPKIIVTKEFNAKPMSVEEAVMQMNLLNKSFFVFKNALNGDTNIVYHRDDGDIGLIEP